MVFQPAIKKERAYASEARSGVAMDRLARPWRDNRATPNIDLRPGRSPWQAVAQQEGPRRGGALPVCFPAIRKRGTDCRPPHGSILLLGFSAVKRLERRRDASLTGGIPSPHLHPLPYPESACRTCAGVSPLFTEGIPATPHCGGSAIPRCSASPRKPKRSDGR
jgi:hypothetical protein